MQAISSNQGTPTTEQLEMSIYRVDRSRERSAARPFAGSRATPAAVVFALVVVGLVAAGCASRPITTSAPPASTSARSARAWEPPPWTPDFSIRPKVASSAAPPMENYHSPPNPDQELLDRYAAAWRAMIAKRNGASAADVDKSLSPTRSWLDRSGTVTRFHVEYTVSVDWARVDGEDSFVVKVDPGDPVASRAPALVGRVLTAEEVAWFADKAPSTASLATVTFTKHLKFDSEAEAEGALRAAERTRAGMRVDGSRPTYEIASKGANRGHVRVFVNVFIDGNFCAAQVVDLVTAKACLGSQHSCVEDIDMTDKPLIIRNHDNDHECAQP